MGIDERLDRVPRVEHVQQIEHVQHVEQVKQEELADIVVEGAWSYGEYDNKYHVKVRYKCPFCGHRHVQQVTGIGSVPDKVFVETKCGQGRCFVKPYRTVLEQIQYQERRES